MISEREFLARLPRSVSHWLGYRENGPKPPAKYLIHLWSFIAAFCGLCVVQGIFNYSSYFIERGVPGIVASYVRLPFFFKAPFSNTHLQVGSISCPRIWCY